MLESADWQPEVNPASLDTAIRATGESKGWSVKENFMLLRAILTGSTTSPPLLDSLVVFGKARTLDRIRRFLLTQQDLAKRAGKYAEQQKVAVRNVRRDALEDLKKAEKAGDISQDEQKRADKDVQGFTDEAVKRIDETLKSKEAEIMQV